MTHNKPKEAAKSLQANEKPARHPKRTVRPLPMHSDPAAPMGTLWARTIQAVAPWRIREYPGYLAVLSAALAMPADTVRRYLYPGGSGASASTADRVIAYLTARIAQLQGLLDEWEAYRAAWLRRESTRIKPTPPGVVRKARLAGLSTTTT